MSPAPCGDPAIPNAAPGNPVKGNFAIAIPTPPTDNTEGRRIWLPRVCILPPDRASRLERPPDRGMISA